MGMIKVARREGFWAPTESGKSELPWPIPIHIKWKGKYKFLFALKQAEMKGHATAIHYKGSSPCRLCEKKRNGSIEYEYRGWIWPAGYRHYIENHTVRPSLAFQEFILARTGARIK